MDNHKLFANGLLSVLVAHWTLRCETALVLRNGKAIYSTPPNGQQPKERSDHLSLSWRQPTGTGHEVAALAYRWVVQDGQTKMVHQVPASALRGTLRNWSLGHLVRRDAVRALRGPKEEDEQAAASRLITLRNMLDDPSSGLPLITSLFGLALETRDEASDCSHVGRLRVETQAFATEAPHGITVNGAANGAGGGPTNVARDLAVRNPLDRITHASKDGGLHHFLEFSSGAEFAVTLRVVNPAPAHAGLLSLWAREISDGMLRLGALSSIGRGRLSVQSPHYTLWQRRDQALSQNWRGPKEEQATADPLAGLYRPYDLGEQMAAYQADIPEAWNHGS